MPYSDSATADARLRILMMLREAPDYMAHEHRLRERLRDDYGHALSIDTLRAHLSWLDDAGLITLAGSQVQVARLTVHGEDVVSGAARYPGVARPGP